MLSVIPIREGALDVPSVDKLLHLSEYLLLAWLLVQALRVNHALQPSYVLWIWIYTTSYGLLIEAIQALLPWRSAELGDAAANALGAALGVWMAQRKCSRIR